MVAHSYGGMPVRAFEGTYPDDVAGMVLIDVSSEPEVPVYERLRPVHGSTGRTDRHPRDGPRAPRCGRPRRHPAGRGDRGIIEDEWLATVPKLAARSQARLAGLSSNACEVVAPDSGHFVHRDAPDVVLTAIERWWSRRRRALAPCEEAFASIEATACRGHGPGLVPA